MHNYQEPFVRKWSSLQFLYPLQLPSPLLFNTYISFGKNFLEQAVFGSGRFQIQQFKGCTIQFLLLTVIPPCYKPPKSSPYDQEINSTRIKSTSRDEPHVVSIATLQIYQIPNPKNLTVSLFLLFPKDPKKSLFCAPQGVKEETTRRKGLGLSGCRWGKEHPAAAASTCPQHLCSTGTLWIGELGLGRGLRGECKALNQPCFLQELLCAHEKQAWANFCQPLSSTELNHSKITVQLLLT